MTEISKLKIAFRLKADVTFEADDILDAFVRLSEYYDALATAKPETSSIFTSGEIEIVRVEEGYRQTLDMRAGIFMERQSPRGGKEPDRG